jgi:tRNA-Thr(GGU) m(6)t(6)A37 methyltransferase TsaA
VYKTKFGSCFTIRVSRHQAFIGTPVQAEPFSFACILQEQLGIQDDMSDEPTIPTLTLEPLGVIHTPMRMKFNAPHQPDSAAEQESQVRLYPGRGFERALADLEGFDRIWLVWWFHRNTTWRPQVMPPRGEQRRRGVFATRSPHRPNPLGITAVPLLGVDGLTLTVGSCDLVDGTPILDIKPYLRTVDAFPDSSLGWLGAVEEEITGEPQFEVAFSPLATEQREWLQKRGVDIFDRAIKLLERDPTPHRTRRITRFKSGGYRMGCGAWKVLFDVESSQVRIREITRGYPLRILLQDGYEQIPDRALQMEFGAVWPFSTIEAGEPPILENTLNRKMR